VIRHRERSRSSVRVLATKGNVLTFIDNCEAKCSQGTKHTILGRINRKLRHFSNVSFRNKGFNHRLLGIQRFWPERLKMEPQRRLHITKRFLVSISLTYDDPFNADRVSNVPIRMFLDDDLKLLHDLMQNTNDPAQARGFK
jgi:hypothetical protein